MYLSTLKGHHLHFLLTRWSPQFALCFVVVIQPFSLFCSSIFDSVCSILCFWLLFDILFVWLADIRTMFDHSPALDIIWMPFKGKKGSVGHWQSQFCSIVVDYLLWLISAFTLWIVELVCLCLLPHPLANLLPAGLSLLLWLWFCWTFI